MRGGGPAGKPKPWSSAIAAAAAGAVPIRLRAPSSELPYPGSSQRIPLVDPDAAADELSVTDDETAIAKIVLRVLGGRAFRGARAPIPATPEDRAWAALFPDEPRAEPALPDEPRPQPVRPTAFLPRIPAVSRHPLDPLVAAVGARLRRLGLAPPSLVILEDIASPIVCYRPGEIALAGQHPQLRAIAAALAARTAWSAAAVDALVAHVVTVLNVALTSVTDAAEAHALGVLLRNG